MVVTSLAIPAFPVFVFHPWGGLVTATVVMWSMIGTSYFQIKMFEPRERPDLPVPGWLRMGPFSSAAVMPERRTTLVTVDPAQPGLKATIFATLAAPTSLDNLGVRFPSSLIMDPCYPFDLSPRSIPEIANIEYTLSLYV